MYCQAQCYGVGRGHQAYYRALVVEEAAKLLILERLLGKARELADEELAAVDGLAAEAYRRKRLANK